MDIFTLILILIILPLFFISWTQLFGAPWMPTPHKNLYKMLELAKIKPGELVYDLGSGDGRVIIKAAQSFGAKAIGIEIDPLRYLWSKLKISSLTCRDRIDVILGNFYNQDLSQADVIIVYLLQDTNIKLIKKFEQELHKDTRIISNTFYFPGLELTNKYEKEKLYAYKM